MYVMHCVCLFLLVKESSVFCAYSMGVRLVYLASSTCAALHLAVSCPCCHVRNLVNRVLFVFSIDHCHQEVGTSSVLDSYCYGEVTEEQ